MTSKELILQKISQNQPAFRSLPDIQVPIRAVDDKIAAFRINLEQSSGNSFDIQKLTELEKIITTNFPSAETIISRVEGFKGSIEMNDKTDPKDLKKVDVALIPSQLGVVENGAVWLTEKDCGQRVLPFICQHLIVLLPRQNLVYNMHEAYQQIKIDSSGFGVFIAGPSKTADIEQSLVIGAHGARSLTVILYPA